MAAGGYEAESACRKVQVERPRASASGGQSGGGGGGGEGGEVGGAGGSVAAGMSFLVMAAQEEKEVQERQLGWWSVRSGSSR